MQTSHVGLTSYAFSVFVFPSKEQRDRKVSPPAARRPDCCRGQSSGLKERGGTAPLRGKRRVSQDGIAWKLKKITAASRRRVIYICELPRLAGSFPLAR